MKTHIKVTSYLLSGEYLLPVSKMIIENAKDHSGSHIFFTDDPDRIYRVLETLDQIAAMLGVDEGYIPPGNRGGV